MTVAADEIIDYGTTLDFQLRQNYLPELIAGTDDTPRPLGKYTRPQDKPSWMSCGLNGCDQPHRYGFVIALQDGRETHCGSICGEKAFGTKWADLMARVRAAEIATATRASVAALLADRDRLVIRSRDVAQRSLRLESRVFAAVSHLGKIGPMVKAIDNCARAGGSIRVAIETPEKGMAGSGRPRIAQLRTVAVIDGIALLTNSFTRFSAVIESARPGLEALSEAGMSGASQKELALRSREGQAFTETLDRAERQLVIGERLFEQGNLKKMELIVEHQLRSADITPRLRQALDETYSLATPLASL